MKFFSQKNHESLFMYVRRVAMLGQYRLWVRRILTKYKAQESSVTINGCELMLPDRPEGIAEELRLFGTHEPHATAIYCSRLQAGMQVLEVGTNIGYYLSVANAKVGGAGKVIGVEPDPELFDIAKRNAEKMTSPIEVKNFAVSDVNGKANFFRSNVSNWGSLRQNSQLNQVGEIEVDVITIDSLVDGEPNFQPDAIRMDIEGHEGAALKGAINTLNSYKPLLFIELHLFMLENDELNEIFDLICACGYSDFIVIDRYYDTPWAWKKVQTATTRSLDIAGLKILSLSPERPNVVSIISL